MSSKDYVRRYWYSHGNWNGGELLTEKSLKKDLKRKETEIDLKSLREIHLLDCKLDRNVLKLVRLLRILSLWRDERKILMQKINLGYVRVMKDAARELKVGPELLKFCLLRETDTLLSGKEKLMDRQEAGTVVYDFTGKNREVKIVTGKEALRIIDKFRQKKEKSTLKGMAASKGTVVGKVKVVLKRNNFSGFRKGMILVTTMTRPEYFSLIKIAKAVVTDEGGITSHAAIISRELGIPCVVGTKIATHVLRDGQMVEVDANKGIVKIIK